MNTDQKLLQYLASMTLPPAAIYLGADFEIKFINAAMEHLWNKSDARNLDELLAGRDPQLLKQARKVLKTGIACHSCSGLTNGDTKDSRPTGRFKCSLLPIAGESGEVIGMLHCCTDTAELQLARESAQRNTDNLKRSNLDLMHFANTVSHDLREPVRKIKIYNNYLQNETRSCQNEKSKHYHDKIEQSTRRMEELIEGVLDYSALNREKQPIKNINLNALFAAIVADLELAIQEKSAKVELGELPEIAGAPILIYQLFYNLVQNALKFNKRETAPVISISSKVVEQDNAEWGVFKIKDNGIGLDRQYAEKIFSAFERLNSKDDYAGNGLGLALCKKITHRHNGFIYAEGSAGIGAEFTVKLPVHQSGRYI